MAKITFIGLGNMGRPMALNILKAGHDVIAFDFSKSAVSALVAEGATTAETALAAARGAECIITMLPADKHVESVYLGPEGLLAQLPARTLLIDSSTVAPETAQRLAEAASSRELDFIDAPVSGGVGGAKTATLTFMCGGDMATFNRARLILESMGKNIFHAGGHGAGQVAKICNNMLLAILMAGTSEALALGERNGLDPTILSNIMKLSSGGNWVLNNYNPWPGVMGGSPASRGYEGGFLVNLMNKDLGLAINNASQSQSPIPMGALASSLFRLHAIQGQGELDFSSILKFYEPTCVGRV